MDGKCYRKRQAGLSLDNITNVNDLDDEVLRQGVRGLEGSFHAMEEL
jgi:hypothetical protein